MHECDVVVLGGAFSGAATALLIKRRRPDARVVIVEKAASFDRKVGESTTEVSSCFLTRVLCIADHLGHEQLAKQGLRFWFFRSSEDPFDQCVEIGGKNNSRLPGFQVDRARLDEHVLRMAVDAGCELWRPVKITRVDVDSRTVEAGERSIKARWIIDATGRVALIARQLGYFRPNSEHPINSLWARFRGVKDWDGYELRRKYPQWAEATRSGRQWATNHLMGYGWWCWVIPLRGGDTSIGLVYDSRLYEPPAGATIADRVKAHLARHPVGREILGEIEPVEGDQRAYSALAYSTDKIAGDGWASVGDAASFIDPFYSSGLDFCAFTSSGAAALVDRALGGEDVRAGAKEYNERFQFCYRAWFEGIYRDKYLYLGDAELMAVAFLLDIANYHLGPVRQVFSDPQRMFEHFPFDGLPGKCARRVLVFFNQRLAAMAKRRLAKGTYGEWNSGWRLLVGGFLPDATSARLLLRGLGWWLRAEWRSLVRTGRSSATPD